MDAKILFPICRSYCLENCSILLKLFKPRRAAEKSSEQHSSLVVLFLSERPNYELGLTKGGYDEMKLVVS